MSALGACLCCASPVEVLLTHHPDFPLPTVPRDEADWASLLQTIDSLSPTQADADAPGMSSEHVVGAQPEPSPQQKAWDIAQDAHDRDMLIELTAQGANQGGLLVEWHGLPGFIPASQLIDFPQLNLPSEREQELQGLIGRRLALKIIELNQAKNRLIFSERAGLVAAHARDHLWRQLTPGQTVNGVVTNMTKFGAFVDLGGLEGLIHLSELSWALVTHPSEVVAPGQAISVVVLNVDRDSERIALSLKRTKPDPWQGISRRYWPGQLVTGTVRKIVSFGAFVTLESELEGLIHVSQLTEGNFVNARDVLQEGQSITARVLDVDEKARRIALTLRRHL